MVGASFPLNSWYASAWSAELGRELQPRTICNIPMVQYRRLDGAPVVLEDACWHRLLPLSMGKLEGDDVECGYHGLVFNASGKCIHMPDGQEPPPRACVRTFPVIERHGLIWIWPGDAALADADKVPDLHWADHPDWACEGSMLEFECDYRLVVDNLLDLTHEAYVHTASIGHKAITTAPFSVSKGDRHVSVERWMNGVDAPPFLAKQLLLARELSSVPKVDRWQLIRFEAPSTIVIDVGVAPVGTGALEGDRSSGISGRVINAITPSTAGKTYYFFAYARDFLIHDPELTAELKASNIKIFSEDKEILERQQESMNLLAGRRLVDLKIDRGSVHARQLIKSMLNLEASG